MITARLEAKNVIKDFKIKSQRFPKATNAAINQMASQTKTFISKEIRSEYNIKAKDLNKNFKLKRSNWKTLNARLDGYGQGISIRAFGARLKRVDFGKYSRIAVFAMIKKSQPAKLIPSTFGLTNKLRTTARRKGRERLPMEKVYGPGVALMFNRKVQGKADAFIISKFPLILERNISFMNK